LGPKWTTAIFFFICSKKRWLPGDRPRLSRENTAPSSPCKSVPSRKDNARRASPSDNTWATDSDSVRRLAAGCSCHSASPVGPCSE